jgi:hypothetical protein
MSEHNDAIPLDRDGRERPVFVNQYPKGDLRLDALVAAFERGDFRSVNTGAKLLLSDSPAPELRAATEDLVRRTHTHPLIHVFLGVSIALFLFCAIWVYSI